MEDEKLREIATTAEAAYESVDAFGGTIWWSQRQVGAAVNTRSFVPGGLHMIAGVSGMSFYSSETGAQKLSGPYLTAMLIPEGGVLMRTKLSAGFASSFGAHVPHEALAESRLVPSGLLSAVTRSPIISVSGTAARCTSSLALKLRDFHSPAARHLLLEARALELVATLTEVVGSGNCAKCNARQRQNARSTRDYIEANLGEGLTLSDVSKAIGISLRTMTDHFKIVFDESVGSYLTRRRLESAMLSISRGSSIAQAAYEFGYQPSGFTHAFKRQYGFTPSKLVQKNR